MYKRVRRHLSFAALLLCCCRSQASWPTFGGDQERSGWAKDETVLSPDSVKQLRLIWKLKLDNEPKELNALTPPIVFNPVYTNKGAQTFVVVGGSSDNVFAIDSDTGKLAWQKHFENAATLPPGSQQSYFCPNGLNDTPAVDWSKDGPTVYIVSADGKLHALAIVTGADRFAPVPFVPAFSKNWSLNIVAKTVYTSLSQGCGLAKSGVYAMDLAAADKKPVFFQSAGNGAGIWGRGGVSAGSDNSIFAATGDATPNPAAGSYGDAVLKLAPKTLELLDYYIPQNAAYLTRKDLDMGNTTPVLFAYKGGELAVIGGKEGILSLLDATSLGGDTHRKPLYVTPLLANSDVDIAGRGFWGGFATWQDPQGTRWVYAPVWGPPANNAVFPVTNGATPNGGIMAFKVEDKNGSPVLTPAWLSRDLQVPEPPVIANGVVFVLSSGEYTRQIHDDGSTLTTAERMSKNPGNATLYALDAATGKELFSSGKTIPSFTHLGGIAVSEGRVVVTAHDNTVYAFGIPGQ